MAFFTAFRIGLLNAWIGTVFALANMIFLVIINKAAINAYMICHGIRQKIKKYPGLKGYRSKEKELLAREIAEEFGDSHSLEAFRAIADKISEQRIIIRYHLMK